MLRIITLNLNGIRSAARKGFHTWLARTRADMPEIIRLAAAGVFRPETMVTDRFPLDEADRAYQALNRGEIVGRAIVLADR